MLPRELALHLTREGGSIENLTAFAAAVGIVIAVLKLLRSGSGIWLSISLIMLWMYLRELDYQKLFTPRSVESIGFYSNSSIPVTMKLIAIAAISPFFAAGLHLLRSGFQEFRSTRGLSAVWWRPLGFAAVLLAAALVNEKLLRPAGQIIEEVFELAFVSLVVLVVATQAFRPKTAPPSPPDTPNVASQSGVQNDHPEHGLEPVTKGRDNAP